MRIEIFLIVILVVRGVSLYLVFLFHREIYRDVSLCHKVDELQCQ